MLGLEKGHTKKLSKAEQKLEHQDNLQTLLVSICLISLVLIFSVFYI